MARLAPAARATWSRPTRLCLWFMRRLFGREPRPYGIYAHAPRAVPTLTVMNAAFETGRWALEPTLRKLVHLRVARIIGCVF